MALFLARAAVPAGVALPANPEGGFTDLVGRSQEIVDAVNQMVALEIMSGTSSTLFSPNVNVTRADMAFMLDAFLGKATIGLGAFGGDVYELSDVSPDDDVFTDIGQVTRGQYSAIQRMYEVGVARGTSDDRFSPAGLVTRAQMAVFITRMLAHTVARPAGLTLQVSDDSVTTEDLVQVAVSVRGTDHMPVPDASIDLFQATDPDEAFGADGRCVSDATSATAGSGLCEIGFGDEQTGPSGDWDTEVNPGDDSVTIWAWTGDVGDRYDADDMTAPSVRITVTKPGEKLRVTDDMPANAEALKFGGSVTFTAQVVDEDGNAVALKDVQFTVTSTETVASAAQGAEPTSQTSSRAYKTDEDGKVELEFSQNDPRSGSGNTGDVSRLDLDIQAGTLTGSTTSFTVEDKTTLEKAGVDGNTADDAAAVWKDERAVPSVLKLTQAVEYHEASSSGRGAANTIVATLTDQYGDPVNRQRIDFTSDDALGIGGCQAYSGRECTTRGLMFDSDSETTRMFTGNHLLSRTTNRRGVASMSYNRKSSVGGIETIMAVAGLGTAAAGDDITADRVYHYWVVEPGNGDSAEGRILKADTENNRLILGGAQIYLVKYDSNDQLNTTSGAAVLADFEKELDDSETMAKYVSVSAYQTASKNVSRITTEEDPLQVVAAYPNADYNPGTSQDYYSRVTTTGTGENAVTTLRSTAVEAEHGSVFAAGGGVLVVGAPGENRETQAGDPATNVGALYVYEGPGDEEPVIIVSGSPATDDRMGASVAVSDDGNTILSGFSNQWTYLRQKPAGQTWASLPNGSHPLTNNAYNDRVGDNIRNTSIWPWPQPIASGDQAENLGGATRVAVDARMFGAAHAISGDASTLVIGAPGDNAQTASIRSGTGLAYVYIVDEGRTWGGTTNTTAMRHPYRGGSGVPDWVSEATGTVGTVTGRNVSTLWPSEGADVTGTTNQVNNFGGAAIAVSKNGSVIAVGAPETNAGAIGAKDDAGAVYVFVQTATRTADGVINWRAVTGPAPAAKLTAGEGTADELLGAAVDISDDGTMIAATAPGSGKVYVFEATGASWGNDNTPDAVITNKAGSNYTSADPALRVRNLAVKADGSEIVVGDAGRAEGDWRGSVAVYTRPSGGWATTDTPSLEWLGSEPNQRFGWQVAYDQSNGDIYASGYKPTYGITTADDPDTADVDEEERGITGTEYTIYHIDRSN